MLAAAAIALVIAAAVRTPDCRECYFPMTRVECSADGWPFPDGYYWVCRRCGCYRNRDGTRTGRW